MKELVKGTTRTRSQKKIHFEFDKNYKVILYNDNVTPFEYVILVFMFVFKKNAAEAFEITQNIHHTGSGVAGIYKKEEAYEKIDQIDALNKEFHYELHATVEEE